MFEINKTIGGLIEDLRYFSAWKWFIRGHIVVNIIIWIKGLNNHVIMTFGKYFDVFSVVVTRGHSWSLVLT